MEFNVGEVVTAVAAAVPERPAVVQGGRRLTYGHLQARTNRLAHALRAACGPPRAERADLAPWESGQAHVGILMHNAPELLETVVGALKARAVPFTMNERYVADELHHLVADARPRVVVVHRSLAGELARAVTGAAVPPPVFLLVDDAPTTDRPVGDRPVPAEHPPPLLADALPYEEVLAGEPATAVSGQPSPDDGYLLYTGGTTGRPKGVLWRQADLFPAALGGRRDANGDEWADLAEVVESARGGRLRFLPTSPLSHGAAQWFALSGLTGGHTVVLSPARAGLDPTAVWNTVASERVHVLLIVGDAFARPLLAELDRAAEAGHPHDTSSVVMVASGGAPLRPALKAALLERCPDITVLDGLGASETGQQASWLAAGQAGPGRFRPGPGGGVLSADRTRALTPADDPGTGPGWMAQHGRIPLGYLGDPDATRRSFPVVGGRRWSVPGDRARYHADGTIELLGRDASTVNTGGEKVYVEEVEAALARHPAVDDVVVSGRPSDRWGEEVVALVQLAAGTPPGDATTADLLATAAPHLARFKLPKAVHYVPVVVRTGAGKPDPAWVARAVGAPP